jgi:hypothetical protein
MLSKTVGFLIKDVTSKIIIFELMDWDLKYPADIDQA